MSINGSEQLDGEIPAAVTVWSPEESAKLYRVENWGGPYFSVNSFGNISVRPHGVDTRPNQEIDLLQVINEISVQPHGVHLPLIVRFPGILKHRLELLQSAFDKAIRMQGYESRYQGVYPVKSNQDRFIVEDLVKFGASFGFGLEAGSKPELLLAMSCLSDGENAASDEALLVCNGFKDSEYIRLALFARRLRIKSVIVLELEQELDLIINLTRELRIRPVIGVRAKLRTRHDGHFGPTSGEKGKFGLTITQIHRIVERLRSEEMLDCLELLHFHIGSQIPSIKILTQGVAEGAEIYSNLVELGAPMGIIDVGGGLGVDYDGSNSATDISVEYSVEQYASTVVAAVRSVCESKGVEHPVICSESGRAIVSHHSVLIFEAFSATDQSDPMTTYHVNLSIFTSIPDFWGIKQLFPILPIHRLNEKPVVRGILSDITCDSDGLMTKFIGGENSLMLHELDGKRYCLGMFLGGAYQEALGGHHNLFGRPSVVRVTRPDGAPHGFALTHGPSCGAILRVMQHDPELMLQTLKQRARERVDNHGELVRSLDRAFENMPYLVMEDDEIIANGHA